MKSANSRSKELETKTADLNSQIAKYREWMQEGIQEFEKMEKDRLESLIACLNQINVFETNCDMNNKYDANNFNEEVGNIETEHVIFEYKKLLKEIDLTKIDTYEYHAYDELMTSEDMEMHAIDTDTEQEYKIEIQKFISKAISPGTPLEQQEICNFSELMNTKIYRYLFVSCLNALENHQLEGEKCFTDMGKLVQAFLKGCNKNNDSDFLKCILTICCKLHYDVEEEDDAVMRTYLTEGIRKNKIWDNSTIWIKAIFKNFREIVRKFKIPKDQEFKLNEDEILRNVLFNRLLFYVGHLSYFDMDAMELDTICTRFANTYKFTEEQREKLSSKYSHNFDFSEETRQKEARGSFNTLISSAMFKMKTYLKKKEIDEDRVPDFPEDITFDEDDIDFVGESTDYSKNTNSESSPPKEYPDDINKEIVYKQPQEKVESAEPTEVVEPAEPVESTEPTESIEPVESTEPVNAVELVEPVE